MDVHERGNLFVGMVIMLSLLGVLLLIIHGAVQRHLLQERLVRNLFVSEKKYVREMYQFLEQLHGQDYLQWDEVGVPQNCQIFANEKEFLTRQVGWYGRKLSVDCSQSLDAQMVGIYRVVDGCLGREVHYSYMRLAVVPEKIERVERWRSFWGETHLIVEVVFNEEIYQYQLPSSASEQSLKVLGSASFLGFYLLVGTELWLLPYESGNSFLVVVDSGVAAREIVVDYLQEDDFYFLQLKRSINGDEIYLSQYSIRNEIWSLKSEKSIFDGEIEFYRVVLMDQEKVVLEIDGQLLAVRWDGSPAWGTRYLWQAESGDKCPLQSESFEPIEGWVLGCQRMKVSGVGFSY